MQFQTVHCIKHSQVAHVCISFLQYANQIEHNSITQGHQWEAFRHETYLPFRNLPTTECFHRKFVQVFPFFFFKLMIITFTIMWSLLYINANSMLINHNYIYVASLPLLYPTLLGFHRAPGWAPNILQKTQRNVLANPMLIPSWHINYLFVYISPT